jgi:hypothetical protein
MGIDNSVIAGPSSAIAASEGGEWAQSRCVQALDDPQVSGNQFRHVSQSVG